MKASGVGSSSASTQRTATKDAPSMMLVTAAAAIGIFLATISQSLSTMILALVLGIGGNAWLAYLALNGRFDGFFDGITLNLIAN